MKILVSGGGTGGHIYPALALIRYIKEIDPTAEFLYVGTDKGLESKIVPNAGIDFKTIEIQGFRRSLSLKNIKTIQKFFVSLQKAKHIIRDFKPDCVIGTGGYVCGPVVYAASKLGIPTIIHEQNSVTGLTNKFLARYVDKICICFKDAANGFPKEKVVYTGNPRAQEVAFTKKSKILTTYNLNPNKETVLIFGGSRGAQKINEAFLEVAEKIAERTYQVLYVSGQYYYDRVANNLKEQKINATNLSVQPYISDMQEVLANVDLTITRAGATSIAEITALGLPSIMIPSPNVTNDHQTKNAKSLVDANAAVMIKDDELNGEMLLKEMDHIMFDLPRREIMAVKAKELGVPDAAARVYQVIEALT